MSIYNSNKVILYAKIVSMQPGHADGDLLIENGYKLGDVLEVTDVDMGSSYTWITATDDDIYNSIHFEFFDDKECQVRHDIYSDPKYNKYIRH